MILYAGQRNDRGDQARKTLRKVAVFLFVFCLFATQCFASPLQDSLKSHVTFLTQLPTGRAPGTAGHRETRKFLNQQLKTIGLSPTGLDLGQNDFEVVDSFSSGLFRHFLGNLLYQAYPINDAGPKNATGEYPVFNVVGVLKSKDPTVKSWRLLIAHYDHLSNRGKQHFPGASDNGAGIAALLEVARLFSAFTKNPQNAPLPFNLMFAFTDREEVSTMGYALVGATLLRDRIQRQWGNLADFLVIAVDLLGVKIVDPSPTDLFFLSHEGLTEDCASDPQLKIHCAPVSILEGMRFPANIFPQDMLDRCDFAPFRTLRVRTAFITGGSPWFYHTPEDTVDRINFSLLEQTVYFLFSTLLRSDLGSLLSPPATQPQAYSANTLHIFSELVELLLSQPQTYPLTASERSAFEKKVGFLQRCETTPCAREDIQKTVFDFLVLIHDVGVRKLK